MLRDYEERTVTKIPKALGAKRIKTSQGLSVLSGQNWGLRNLQGELTATLQACKPATPIELTFLTLPPYLSSRCIRTVSSSRRHDGDLSSFSLCLTCLASMND